MTSLRNKFIMLLADTSYSNSEIKDFLAWLRNGGVDKIDTVAKNIRNTINKIDMSEFIEDDNYDPNVNVNRSLKSMWMNDNKIYNKIEINTINRIYHEIERLLLRDARLSKSDAMNLLAEKTHVSLHLKNKSFANAVHLLADAVGESKLLSAAEYIRNNIINNNSNKIAWPLNEENNG